MGAQYLAFYQELLRGIPEGAPDWLFYPTTNTLRPTFTPDDASRKEFKGVDSGLGDDQGSVRRKTSQDTASYEMSIYPGRAIGLWLRHLFGFASVRTLVDISAYKGLLRPVNMPYGDAAYLGDKAIALVPNTDEIVDTLSQVFGGNRPTSLSLTIAPPEDIVCTIEFAAPGEYVGDPDQPAIPAVSFPLADAFLSRHVKCYIGAGASRVGVAPDFTDIIPDAMTQFKPDEVTLTFNFAREDKAVIDGIEGPNQTTKSAQMSAEVSFTIDYADPAAGFNSSAEFKKVYTGPNLTPLMFVFDNKEIVPGGAVAQTSQWTIDFPVMLLVGETPTDDPEGKTRAQSFSGMSKIDAAIGYPFALQTIDDAADYGA